LSDSFGALSLEQATVKMSSNKPQILAADENKDVDFFIDEPFVLLSLTPKLTGSEAVW
jgi:hypothetical protein